MIIFRWFVFLPAAFVASVIAGALVEMAGILAFGPIWITWFIGGIFSGATFAFVGSAIAPKRSTVVKWVLVCLIIGLGLAAALGGLLSETERDKALRGLGMVLNGFAFALMPIQNWGEEAIPESSNPEPSDK